MNKITNNNSIFESIKHIDENGIEYWYAREMMPLLQYSKWQNFKIVINKAINTCKSSNLNCTEHFTDVSKVLKVGNGAVQIINDHKLSRYACYLIAQNGDSRKKVIALAQTYFAVQTRKQELLEKEYESLTEDEKRFYQRNLTKKGNYMLNQVEKNAGVKNFDRFHNYGYKGLYNGENANDIAKRKGLRYREEILDNMGSTIKATTVMVNGWGSYTWYCDSTTASTISEMLGEAILPNVWYTYNENDERVIYTGSSPIYLLEINPEDIKSESYLERVIDSFSNSNS